MIGDGKIHNQSINQAKESCHQRKHTTVNTEEFFHLKNLHHHPISKRERPRFKVSVWGWLPTTGLQRQLLEGSEEQNFPTRRDFKTEHLTRRDFKTSSLYISISSQNGR
jgi:hypothetical protein